MIVEVLVRAVEAGAFDDLFATYWVGEDDDADAALARELLARAEGLVGAPVCGRDVQDLAYRVAGGRSLPQSGTIGLLARAERYRYHEGRP